MTLPEQITSTAGSIVSSLVQTDYQYAERIDVRAGIYDCDCNGFVGFVLETLAPLHYGMILPEPTQPRPRGLQILRVLCFTYPRLTGWLVQNRLPGECSPRGHHRLATSDNREWS